MKIISFLILFILFAGKAVFTQEEHSVIAKIGEDIFSAKDFKLRLELSPYIPTNAKVNRLSDNEFKKDFLYSLLAEMLWAKEADRIGIGSTDKFKLFFQPLEDMFVRDGLFKQEIRDKAKLSAKEVNDAIEKSQFKLQTFIVISIDSARIHHCYNQLLKQSDFDSVLSMFPELDTATSEVVLAGLKDESIEDSLFKLRLNEFTPPLKTEIGWVIFKLINKTFTPIDLNDEAAVNNAKDAVRDRKIEKRYLQYMTELLSETSIIIDSISFNKTYDIIWRTLKDKPVSKDYTNYYPLEERDFQTIINFSDPNALNQTLFTIYKKKLVIKDFIADLAFNGFSIDELDSILVLNRLAQRVKQFVEEQLITSEGYKLGVNLSPEVRNDISLWKQKYLAELYFKTIMDSMIVSENEIYEVYLKDLCNGKNFPIMNIRLITLNNLDAISEILDQLQEGKSFADVIKYYGKTDPLVNEFGETGLKPIILLDDIGKIAAQLKINEIHGPIQRNKSYSIFQVFEKTDSVDSFIPAYDSVKYELRNGLRLKKTIGQLTKSTSELAEKYGVKIFNDQLEKIKITQIPMFMHRFMGFGGRIAGMPLLTPFSEWIENTDIKKLLP